MKNQTCALWLYSALLFIGGFIGFLKAGSVISLVMASLFAAALIGCGIALKKGYFYAYKISLGLLSALFLIFTVRFFSSYKFMPSGMIMTLTLLTLLYLLFTKNKALQPSEKEQ